MSSRLTPAGNGCAPGGPLRVHRIEPGTISVVRCLSAIIGGLFTHYQRGRSVYCEGLNCPPALHRMDRVWKGYIAGELHKPADDLWYPVVLEITEHAELWMRERYGRGQIWAFRRQPELKGKRSPVEPELLETRDPEGVPKPFDIVGCLLHLYHRDSLDLTQRNPLPPRLCLPPSQAEPPVFPSRPAPAQTATAEPMSLNDLFKKITARVEKNGKGGVQ